MFQQRMSECDFFGNGERIIARKNTELRESGGGTFGNWRTRERMWQGFGFWILFERDMRRFVGRNENKNCFTLLCAGWSLCHCLSYVGSAHPQVSLRGFSAICT